jgi:signal transduction histidine kinase
MHTSSVSLGDLLRQPAYAGRASRAAYYARFYRSIVFAITLVILLLNVWRYRNSPSPPVITLGLALVVYIVYFLVRMYLSAVWPTRLFHPHTQFVRCQSGVIGVTVLLGILAAYGIVDNELWMLYVLATLPLSERLSTWIVLVTLAEVAVLFLAASYIGSSIYHQALQPLIPFVRAAPYVVSRILCIWLINFVLHYLVRNVQARDQAYQQHQDWLTLIQEKTLTSDDPGEQRRAVVASAETLTGAHVELWIPRICDRRPVSLSGESAGAVIGEVIQKNQACVALRPRPLPGWAARIRSLWRKRFPQPTGGMVLLSDPPFDAGVSTQIIVPINRFQGSEYLLAVLDLRYSGRPLSDHQLELQHARLQDFVEHARVVLTTSVQNEHQQLIDRLANQLDSLQDPQVIARQVVENVVSELGFDFATFSVVDAHQATIRCIAGQHADWVADSVHALGDNDVQSIVARTAESYRNDGAWEPCLDKRIWRKYCHHQMTRIWVPICHRPPPGDSDPVLGTVEAGFRHEHSRTISTELVDLLERYADHIYLVLLVAQRQERQKLLIESLTALHEMSTRLQRMAALYDSEQMARLIGQSAEALLKADLVSVHAWDAGREQCEVLYMTPGTDVIQGKGQPSSQLREHVREELSAARSHFAVQAQSDPILINLKPDGQPDHARRTFTQRQNIQSFAGLALTGKSGEVIGFLCLNFRTLRHFYDEERQILLLFAEQAAAALEQTHDHHLARSVAILQERANLAAELHANLSQELRGMREFVQAAMTHANNGHIDKAIPVLDMIWRTVLGSIDSLHRTLSVWRETPNPETDFVDDLKAHIERLQERYASRIEFSPEVRTQVAGQVQFYLLRVAYEALNNAMRYAPGADVRVSYCADEASGISLIVEDHGPGFSLDQVAEWGRHGLFSMEHFAKQIHGRLTIQSRPGQGTRIGVLIAQQYQGGS